MSQYQEPRRGYFKCKVCSWIFQFGTITNFVQCPACGAIDSKPKLADKMDWIEWQRRQGKISSWQRRFWNPHVTDL